MLFIKVVKHDEHHASPSDIIHHRLTFIHHRRPTRHVESTTKTLLTSRPSHDGNFFDQSHIPGLHVSASTTPQANTPAAQTAMNQRRHVAHHSPRPRVHAHDKRPTESSPSAVLAGISLVGVRSVLEDVIRARHLQFSGASPRCASAFAVNLSGGGRGEGEERKMMSYVTCSTPEYTYICIYWHKGPLRGFASAAPLRSKRRRGCEHQKCRR